MAYKHPREGLLSKLSHKSLICRLCRPCPSKDAAAELRHGYSNTAFCIYIGNWEYRQVRIKLLGRLVESGQYCTNPTSTTISNKMNLHSSVKYPFMKGNTLTISLSTLEHILHQHVCSCNIATELASQLYTNNSLRKALPWAKNTAVGLQYVNDKWISLCGSDGVDTLYALC